MATADDRTMIAGKALCLNMIVKNEMANLERCLGAVAPHIACWVIGDTGSTDGTQDFIRSFFAARNIPGELHSFPFENFEQARNAALDRAYASPLAFDYLLFDDADMELVVEDADFRTRLTAPSYRLSARGIGAYLLEHAPGSPRRRGALSRRHPRISRSARRREGAARRLVQGSRQRRQPRGQVRARHPTADSGAQEGAREYTAIGST